MNDIKELKKKKLELLKEKERRLCKKSLFYFAKEVLGYKELSDNVHREWEEFIKKDSLQKLILVPRGHFKTSFFTVAAVMQEIIKDPNIRILLSSATHGLAVSFLREIKTHFETNQRLRDLFGDYVSDDKKWAESQIIVNKRTRIFKEPTVQAAGAGGTLVSQHYDLAVFDDIVNEVNVYTKEQIEKVINWYKAAQGLLDPLSRSWVIGTRWHYGDLYGYLLEHRKKKFDILLKKAYLDNGEPYFKERFTEEVLAGKKYDIGSAFFTAQYMNEPVSAEHAIFKIEWLDKAKERGQNFRLKQSHDVDLTNTPVVIGVDVAISVKDSADYFALIVLGVWPNGDIRILHIFRHHISKKEQMDTIQRYNALFYPKIIYVENNAYQEALVQDLKSETSVPVRGFTTGKEKNMQELGIPSMAVQFENGKFILPRGDEESIRMTDILIQELLQYPKGHTGDLVMALWLAWEASKKYCSSYEYKAEENVTDEVIFEGEGF